MAACDISQAAVDSFGRQFAVDRRYTVLEEMLEKEPIDIAITCTGAVYQPAVAIRIAESGRVRTMLCEKPLSQTAADAKALIAACSFSICSSVLRAVSRTASHRNRASLT